MAIQHVNVAIKRDEYTTLRVQVAKWEVPILHLVHKEGAVSELEGTPYADVDPPSVQDEYRRLQAKYRPIVNDDGSPGQHPVVMVYGSFGGSPLLAQAIQEATIEKPADLMGDVTSAPEVLPISPVATPKAKGKKAATPAASLM